MLVLSYTTGTLYQVQLTPTLPDPQVILSPGDWPQLASMKTLALFDHHDLGRIAMLKDVKNGVYGVDTALVARDADNDGIFESFDHPVVNAQFYDDYGYEDMTSAINFGLTLDDVFESSE